MTSHLLLVFLRALVQIVLIVVLTGTTILTIYSFYVIVKRRKYRHLPGPPIKSFILGNAKEMIACRLNRHKLWLRWTKLYGPIFRVTVFHLVMVVVSEPRLAREICLDSEAFPKSREVYGSLRNLCGTRFLGASVLTATDNQHWKVRRLGLNPAFHASFLKELITTFNASADLLVETLDQFADGEKVVDLQDYIGRTTLDVISNVGFGFYPDIIRNTNSPFTREMFTMLKTQTEVFRDPLLAMGLNPFKRGIYKAGAHSTQFLRNTGRNLIRARAAAIARGEDHHQDMLSIMIKNLGSKLNEQEMIDEFLTFFFAGQDTISNTMTFLLMLLGKHPEEMTNAVAEVDKLIQSPRQISHEDIKNLTFCAAAWKEALRLYPTAYGTARETLKKEVLSGFGVPKDSLIFICFLGIHYHYLDDGHEFKPQRFLNGDGMESSIFFPFSIGQRSCIGRNFAYFESMVLLAKLLSNYEISLVPNQKFDIDEVFTFRLNDGLKVHLKKRNA